MQAEVIILINCVNFTIPWQSIFCLQSDPISNDVGINMWQAVSNLQETTSDVIFMFTMAFLLAHRHYRVQ